jgi:hypothetical protein
MIRESERRLFYPWLQLEGHLEGHAPVQAKGTVAGHLFYFRARHDEWAFSISLSVDVDPVDVQFPDQGFLREGQWGQPHREDASYMDYDDAENLIKTCAQEFLQLKRE